MIESVLHTHTYLQSLTTKCYCKLTKGIVSYSSVCTWIAMSATVDTKQIELSRLRLCLIIIEVFLPLKLQNLAKKQKESEGQSQ